MINYSFIIPHKNIPELLEICLDSIPVRKDMEIIIVDDNSDDEIAGRFDFPGKNRENCKVIFTKDGKGAGYARNTGMKNARGKWLLFADADDFFKPDFMDIIDEYRDTEADIVFFQVDAVDLISGKYSSRIDYLEDIYKMSDGKRQEWNLRYTSWIPTGKMIRHSFVEDHKFAFSEVLAGNDMIFSFNTGHYAKNIIYDPKLLYTLTNRDGSLASKSFRSINVLRSRIGVCLELLTLSKRYDVPEKIALDFIVDKWFKMLYYSKTEFIKEFWNIVFSPDLRISSFFMYSLNFIQGAISLRIANSKNNNQRMN